MQKKPFLPHPRILMGPGPSDVHPRVLAALGRPTIGHLDPQFVSMMDEIKELLRYLFRTKNEMTMPISAPGSAGMEFCLVNLVEPGDKVVICTNGVFGSRMQSIVERIGGTAVIQNDDWGEPVNTDKLAATLKDNPDTKLVCFVHAETSTGARSDAAKISELAKSAGALVLADTVTSLGGIPVEVDDWQLDAVYSGSQKCLSCTPGLSPVTLSKKAVAKVKNRKAAVVSWFLDVNLLLGYWGGGGKRAYHHTAPINALYALHESLVMVAEEGLENVLQRHARHHKALAAGLEAMGLDFLVDVEYRLPMLNSVKLPEGTDDAAVRKMLLDEYNLEIGAGLGAYAGKVWRIGLMGQSCKRANVAFALAALESALKATGAKINEGRALSAADRVY